MEVFSVTEADTSYEIDSDDDSPIRQVKMKAKPAPIETRAAESEVIQKLELN